MSIDKTATTAAIKPDKGLKVSPNLRLLAIIDRNEKIKLPIELFD